MDVITLGCAGVVGRWCGRGSDVQTNKFDLIHHIPKARRSDCMLRYEAFDATLTFPALVLRGGGATGGGRLALLGLLGFYLQLS